MKQYHNLFAEIGKSDEAVRQRINETFETMFFHNEDRIYFESGPDLGYLLDTGNLDARTEGMSYGMMMAVQMDRKDIFDRLWRFSKTHMHQKTGKYQGYFAWSVSPEGEKNSEGPAPDGEEYYALALFFAAARWGDGEGMLNYTGEARDILRHCLHQRELTEDGEPMWNAENHCIKFVPEADYSDPSYHLPHFYELFAERADERDRPFWKKAADASREYIETACHPVTGMAPEYAEFDGTPKRLFHDGQFYSDAYRVAMNIALDACWFGGRGEWEKIAERLQAFFMENTEPGVYHNYMIDGTALDQPALHPTAIIATTAAASLAAEGPHRQKWLQLFWDTPPRRGDRRYYDNCLYFFSLLMLGGAYRIY